MSIFLLETGSRRTDWPHRKARFARHASRMVALRATITSSCVNRSSSGGPQPHPLDPNPTLTSTHHSTHRNPHVYTFYVPPPVPPRLGGPTVA